MVDRLDAQFATFAHTLAIPDAAPADATLRTVGEPASSEKTLFWLATGEGERPLPTVQLGGVRAGARAGVRHGGPTAEPASSDLDVLSTLGEGGMGVVYLARQHSLGRNVAVKTTRDDVETSVAASALVREGRITGSLEHPNIAPVHLLGRDATGKPVLVMKRVEGVSWATLLADRNHPMWRTVADDPEDSLGFHLEVLIQVCNAVHFAHASGVIHRDIKPDNVMIGSFGEVWLLDWGVALRVDETFDSSMHGIVGTPCYMAPEMVIADPTLATPRTDVYLLGAVLHELLVGVPPHRGAKLLDVLSSAYDSVPPRFPKSVPRALADLSIRAMARSSDARPATAILFRDELRTYLRHRGAIRVANAAASRVETHRVELTEAADPSAYLLTEAVGESLAASRLALRGAIVEWKDDPFATEALASCVRLLALRELARRNVDGAKALRAEIPGDDDDLDARIAIADDDLRIARETEAQMLIERAQRDPRKAAGMLFAVLSLLVMVSVVGGIVATHEELRTGRPTSIEAIFWQDGVVLFLFLATVFAGRRRLFANRIGVELTGVVFATFAWSVVVDGFLMFREGSTAWDSVVLGSIVVSAILSVGALTLRRDFAAPAIAMAVVPIVAVVWPWLSMAAAGIGTAVAVAVFVVIFYRTV